MEAASTPVAPAGTGAGTKHVPGIDSPAQSPSSARWPSGHRPAGTADEGALNTAIAHSAGGAGSRAIDRDIKSERGTARGRLDPAPAGDARTIGARVATTRTPVLDGRNQRAVIRTVPRIT